MIRLFRRKQKKAFTLIELLVVIAIIALLAALLTPAVTSALLKGRVTQVRNNGINIYKLLFARELDNPLGLQTAGGVQVAWPRQGDFTDSTAFFATLVTNEVFGLSYNFFAAPGIVPAISEQQFLDNELRNAWVIAEDVSSRLRVSTPVLYTQNIDAPGLDQFNNANPLNEDELPFGSRAGVIVTYGGSGFDIDSSTALATNFNPTAANNTVIYPKNGQH
ncbi:MAG TPA: prepilin-type N-terminal cleavage/methylation domain-containing protein [Kiritimatiellia bacterium]|nr:prepilin-type N-terminal cleavage/methylation domain-containing protein [Kiritimatiellia bacterium]